MNETAEKLALLSRSIGECSLDGVRAALKAMSNEEKGAALFGNEFEEYPLPHYVLRYALTLARRQASDEQRTRSEEESAQLDLQLEKLLEIFKEILSICNAESLALTDKNRSNVPLLALLAGENYVSALLETNKANWRSSHNIVENPFMYGISSPCVRLSPETLQTICDQDPQIVDMLDSSGSSILHKVPLSHDLEKIAFCLDKVVSRAGGSISYTLMLKNGIGQTPLHVAYSALSPTEFAPYKSYIESEGRLKPGIDLTLKDNSGKSIICLALENGHVDDMYQTCKDDPEHFREFLCSLLENHKFPEFRHYLALNSTEYATQQQQEEAQVDVGGEADSPEGSEQSQSVTGPSPEERADQYKKELYIDCIEDLLATDPQRLCKCLKFQADQDTPGHPIQLWEEICAEVLDYKENELEFARCVLNSNNKPIIDFTRQGCITLEGETSKNFCCALLLSFPDSEDILDAVDLYEPIELNAEDFALLLKHNPSPKVLSNALQYCESEIATHRKICELLTRPVAGGVSAMESAIANGDELQIRQVVRAASDDKLAELELTNCAINLASSGDIDKLSLICSLVPEIIYAESSDGRSILEVASDNDQTHIVHFLINAHKRSVGELLTHDIVDYSSNLVVDSIKEVATVSEEDALKMAEMFAEKSDIRFSATELESLLLGVPQEYAEQFLSVLGEPRSSAARALPLTYQRPYKPPSSKRSTPPPREEKKTETPFSAYSRLPRGGDDFQCLGNLAEYMPAFHNYDSKEFKKYVEESLKSLSELKQTAFDNGQGHSLFTLAAAHGDIKKYEILKEAFKDKSTAALAPGTSVANLSSLGSPLQCAIASGAQSMVGYLVNKLRSGREIFTPSRSSGNNLLHTIIESGHLETFRLLSDSKALSRNNRSEALVEALQHKNISGKTPLDLASECGSETCSELCSFLEKTLTPRDMSRILTSSTLPQEVVRHHRPYFLQWMFQQERRIDEASERSISLLGNQNYTKHLVLGACKGGNVLTIQTLLDRVREREDRISFNKILEEVCEDLVEENNYNPETFQVLADFLEEDLTLNWDINFFVGQGVIYNNPGPISKLFTSYQNEEKVLRTLRMKLPQLVIRNKINILRFLVEHDQEHSSEIKNEALEVIEGAALSGGISKEMGNFYLELLEEPTDTAVHVALSSGNLRAIAKLVNENPEILLQEWPINPNTPDGNKADSIYELARILCPPGSDKSTILKFLGHALLDLVLEREEALDPDQTIPKTLHGTSTPTSEHPPVGIGEENLRRLAPTITGILISHAKEISHAKYRRLEHYIDKAAERAFEGDDVKPSLLYLALTNFRTDITSKLLREYARLIESGSVEEGEVGEAVNRKFYGCSSLHLAAILGDYQIFNQLLSLGGDPAQQTDRGENVAHLCARSGMKDSSGRYVFADLVENTPDLNVEDSTGAGMLLHAAMCPDPELVEEMLELIFANPHLDKNLENLSPEDLHKYLLENLKEVALERPDSSIEDFIEDRVNIPKQEFLRNLLEESTKSRVELDRRKIVRLANLLNRESTQSPSAVVPFTDAEIRINREKKQLIEHQDILFSVVNSGALYGALFDEIRNIPTEAFFAMHWKKGISPIEQAIATENLDFIKYVLKHRSEEIKPNIRDSRGRNLPVQLAHFVVENPEVIEDQEFLQLYKNLIEKCRCTIAPPGEESVKSVLAADSMLRDSELYAAAQNALLMERELQLELLKIEKYIPHVYKPEIVRELSLLAQKDPEFAKNAANPFYTLSSRVLVDITAARKGISESCKSYLINFLRHNEIKKLLHNVDRHGNNSIQQVLKDLSAHDIIGFERENILKSIFSILMEQLPAKELEKLFLEHRNIHGENCVEMLASVTPALSIFELLESKLGRDVIAKKCDLDAMLTKSASQGALQRYICNKYSLFPIAEGDIYRNLRIHRAVISGNHDAFLTAMQTGGRINLVDKNGNTPLHNLLIHLLQNREKVQLGHVEILKTLVSHGASLDHKNAQGLSVCDIAKQLFGDLFGEDKSSHCLELIARQRLEYYNINSKIRQKAEKSFVKVEKSKQQKRADEDESKQPLLIGSNFVGSTVDLKMSAQASLLTSQLLNSKLYQKYHLSAVKFDFNDGVDQGYVEKCGTKRNYVTTSGIIKIAVSWTPEGGKKQKVTVMVNADGTLSVHESCLEKCGPHGEGLNFKNCNVFLGGISLKNALQAGRWKPALTREEALRRAEQQGVGDDLGPDSERERGTQPPRSGDEDDLDHDSGRERGTQPPRSGDGDDLGPDSERERGTQPPRSGDGDDLDPDSGRERGTQPPRSGDGDDLGPDSERERGTQPPRSGDGDEDREAVPTLDPQMVDLPPSDEGEISEPEEEISELKAVSSQTETIDPERRAWENLVGICTEIGTFYAFDYRNPQDFIEATEEVIKHLQKKNLTLEPLDLAIPEIMDKHGIVCVGLGNPNLKILNGEAHADDVGKEGFTSRYGFGPVIDSEIQALLDIIKKISDTSNIFSCFTIPLMSLPSLTRGIENVKKRDLGVPFPVTESGEVIPISQESAERILKGIIHSSLVCQNVEILRKSPPSVDEPSAKVEPSVALGTPGHPSMADKGDLPSSDEEEISKPEGAVSVLPKTAVGPRTPPHPRTATSDSDPSHSDSEESSSAGEEMFVDPRANVDPERSAVSGLPKTAVGPRTPPHPRTATSDSDPSHSDSEESSSAGEEMFVDPRADVDPERRAVSGLPKTAVGPRTPPHPRTATSDSDPSHSDSEESSSAGEEMFVDPRADVDPERSAVSVLPKTAVGPRTPPHPRTATSDSDPSHSDSEGSSSAGEEMFVDPRADVDPERSAWKNLLRICEQCRAFFAVDYKDPQIFIEASMAIVKHFLEQGIIVREPIHLVIPRILAEHGITHVELDNPTLKLANGEIVGGTVGPEGFTSRYGFGPKTDAEIQASLGTIKKIAAASNSTSIIRIPLGELPSLRTGIENVKKPGLGAPFPVAETGEIIQFISKKDVEDILKIIVTASPLPIDVAVLEGIVDVGPDDTPPTHSDTEEEVEDTEELGATDAEQLAWVRLLRVCDVTRGFYAVRYSDPQDFIRAVKEITRAFKARLSPELLRILVPRILGKNNISCTALGDPELKIVNGAIVHSVESQDFTSRYGFGPKTDAEIQARLSVINSIAHRSRVNCIWYVRLSALPGVIEEVDALKGEIQNQFPGITGIDDPKNDDPIPPFSGMEILRSLMSLEHLCVFKYKLRFLDKQIPGAVLRERPPLKPGEKEPPSLTTLLAMALRNLNLICAFNLLVNTEPRETLEKLNGLDPNMDQGDLIRAVQQILRTHYIEHSTIVPLNSAISITSEGEIRGFDVGNPEWCSPYGHGSTEDIKIAAALRYIATSTSPLPDRRGLPSTIGDLAALSTWHERHRSPRSRRILPECILPERPQQQPLSTLIAQYGSEMLEEGASIQLMEPLVGSLPPQEGIPKTKPDSSKSLQK